jgi:hypothetical protein
MQCKVMKKRIFYIFIATCNVMQGRNDHAMYHEVGEQNDTT